ncbi:unnamed protein product [Knipowitschia caucasica]|uniref:Uncharacterized protein n=1 Tax=Knipowitschia caucasica TaxID=637954 RepID=A0AAV2J4M3_KNICA
MWTRGVALWLSGLLLCAGHRPASTESRTTGANCGSDDHRKLLECQNNRKLLCQGTKTSRVFINRVKKTRGKVSVSALPLCLGLLLPTSGIIRDHQRPPWTAQCRSSF